MRCGDRVKLLFLTFGIWEEQIAFNGLLAQFKVRYIMSKFLATKFWWEITE
jgi:hypothetical protein